MEFRDHDFLAEYPVVETDVGKLSSKKEKKMRRC